MQPECNGKVAILLRTLVKKLVDKPEERKRLLGLAEAGEYEAALTELERIALELAKGGRPLSSPKGLIPTPYKGFFHLGAT